MDREKVIKALGCFCDSDGPDDCPCEFRFGDHTCDWNVAKAAIELLKEQERQLNEYHKADTFLAVHGFWSDNPPYGVKTSVELERP